ncbi:MAG: phosphoenolpyruvate synthase [Candidatus Nanoarchaeia archaeon]|nr:phosphoenolpyruvate synthase [Candidatus Nanoarchaeia archaeon]
MVKRILWLKDLSKNSLNIAGGKAANLGEMYNSGLPVPSAFVVTTDTYKEFLELTGLKDKILSVLSGLDVDNTSGLMAVAKEIQEMIVSASVPSEIKFAIIDAYKKMNIGGDRYDALDERAMQLIGAGRDFPYVAARSSATAEDLPGASFAGQQKTLLFIKGDEPVVNAVKECWASLFTARSIFYRTKHNFPHDKVYIAVVVQKMLDSEKSGVAFSINPVNGDDEIVVEAGWGVGEAIVAGKVNPDLYIVDKQSLNIKSKKINEQTWMYTRDITGNKLGVIKKPLSSSKAKEQVLSDEQIKELSKYILKIEQLYSGVPQDIEWAVEEARLYIVQSRPVTAIEEVKKRATEKVEHNESMLILKGLSASPGVASGVVRVINSADDVDKIQKGDILVTTMTDPDFVPAMKKASAIVTDEGGMTSHAAIVSRELGVPCIVGTESATKKLQSGMNIIVDATSGKVYRADSSVRLAPQEQLQEQIEPVKESEFEEHNLLYSEKDEEKDINKIIEEKESSAGEISAGEIAVAEEFENDVFEAPKQSAVLDLVKKYEDSEMASETENAPYEETRTKIYMNLGVPEKAEQYKKLPFDGVGLMRIEFIIASSIKGHPMKLIKDGRGDEYSNKLTEGIEKVASAVYPKPVIVRFSDFKTNEYSNLEGGAEFEPKEENPMIGWRGCSRYIHEDFEKAFRLECRAIKKARQKYRNIWVMLPFVRTVWEVKKVVEIMKTEGLSSGHDFKIGIMAELPSIIFMADEFSKITDFFSIGSNDLTQLILGVDRDSARLGKMNYFDERNSAVLRAVKYLIDTAHKHNVPVSICGQAPSVYPEFTEFLVRCGIDSISVNPDVVASTRTLVAKTEKKVDIEKISENTQMF